MLFQFCFVFVFLGRKYKVRMYALAGVVVSYFFFCMSLYGLHCCDGLAQAWGYPLGVGWPFELL